MKNQVLSTVNYDQFKPNPRNRGGAGTDPRHVKDLAADFLLRGQQEPIQVAGGNTGDLKVISGHHRLEAAKLAGVPVKYFISEEASTVDVMHAHRLHKSWTLQNFVDFFDNGRNENYRTFCSIQEKTGLSVGAVFLLLFGKGMPKRGNPLTEGTLKLDGKTFLGFKNRWSKIQEMTELRDGLFAKKITAVKFLEILVVLIEHPLYDHEHFIKRLNSIAPHQLTTINNFKDGAMMLSDVYNKHRADSKKIDVLKEFENRNKKTAELAA